MAATQKLLEKYLTSPILLLDLQQVKSNLKEKQHARGLYFYQRNTASWSQKQDRVNRAFFDQFKQKYKTLSIKSLKRLDGSYTTDDSEMRDIATTYYHQLLSAKSFLEEDINKRQLVLETIQQKVTHVMASQLLQPFTDTEVWTTAKSLGKYVCPRKDAIGMVFYLHYWDLLGLTLTRAINLIFSTGNMHDEWTEGIIYMIPKSDSQRDEISKWCPITLLNDIYKIVAKTIANRM